MVSTVEEWIKAQPEGNELFVKTWIPEGEPKATVLFVHGFGEHICRYDRLFADFSSAGIKVTAFDQRGFGQTVKKFGSKGHHQGESVLHDDIKNLMTKSRINGVPHFLMGHSMGGAIVLHYCLNNKEDIRGVISSSPLIVAGRAVTLNFIETTALKVLPRFIPTFALPKPLDAKLLSRDETVGKEYSADPLVHAYASLLTGSEMIKRGDVLLSESSKFTLPLLMVHGEADCVTSPGGSKQFFDGISSTDKEYKSFEGARHELHNELPEIRAELNKLYLEWILQRSSKL